MDALARLLWIGVMAWVVARQGSWVTEVVWYRVSRKVRERFLEMRERHFCVWKEQFAVMQKEREVFGH